MEDYRLPSPHVGLLRLLQLKGMFDFNVSQKSYSSRLQEENDHEQPSAKPNKPPTTQKTAPKPTHKPTKTPYQCQQTPSKPTPPPLPMQKPTPPPPTETPQPTQPTPPLSPPKLMLLSLEPTPQRHASPAQTPIKPSSPMQIGPAPANCSTTLDSTGKKNTLPETIEHSFYNRRLRLMHRFSEKGWRKPRKIWYDDKQSAYIAMYTRPNRNHSILCWSPKNRQTTLFKGPDSKFHVTRYHD